MTKQIAFLIWLYDRQLELGAVGDPNQAEVDSIREKYMEFFGINDDLNRFQLSDD